MISRQEQSVPDAHENRVALSAPLTHAYLSHGRNCKSYRNCSYACPGVLLEALSSVHSESEIRGP